MQSAKSLLLTRLLLTTNDIKIKGNYFSKKLLTKRVLFVIIIHGHKIRCYEYAAMAQLVEHILGKDEVPSSNLGSSSKNPECCCIRDFYYYYSKRSKKWKNSFLMKSFPKRRSASATKPCAAIGVD